jgi:DNA-binding NarL/FixJ family response regulator
MDLTSPGRYPSAKRFSSMQVIRVVIVNDHPIVRSNLRLLLERESDVRVIGEAANGREAVLLAEYQKPDIVLLDAKLQEMSGVQTAREMLKKNPALNIVFISALTADEYVIEALKLGAHGYVTGDSAQSDLVPAVRAAAKGERFLSPAIAEQLAIPTHQE